LLLLICSATAPAAAGDKRNAPGVTDTEIKLGQTMPYSGAASAWGADGLAGSTAPPGSPSAS